LLPRGILAFALLAASSGAAAYAQKYTVANVNVGIGAYVERQVEGLVEPAIELGMRTRRLQGTVSAGARFGFEEDGSFDADLAWSASVLLHVIQLPPELITAEQMMWRNERAVYVRAGARMIGTVDTVAPWLGIGLSKGCVFGELGWALELDGDDSRHQLLAVVGVSMNPFCYSSPP
jgi:hypothetical protein